MQVARELLGAEAALNTTHSKVLFSSKQCFTAKRLTTIYSIQHHSPASATSGAVVWSSYTLKSDNARHTYCLTLLGARSVRT